MLRDLYEIFEIHILYIYKKRDTLHYVTSLYI